MCLLTCYMYQVTLISFVENSCFILLLGYVNKKLSYRKQIASQLRTQYVEGIYGNSVTLKSGLRVVPCH